MFSGLIPAAESTRPLHNNNNNNNATTNHQPQELVKVGKILDALDKERGMPPVRPVFISVDPDRDNVAQLRHYAQGGSVHAAAGVVCVGAGSCAV